MFKTGDALYESMLDPSMTYTCAYWKDANNLEEAQLAKLDLVARKLKLEPGMRVRKIFGQEDLYTKSKLDFITDLIEGIGAGLWMGRTCAPLGRQI